MTLEQVKAARLVRDYEGRFGATSGFWTTDAFVEAAYKSLSGEAVTVVAAGSMKQDRQPAGLKTRLIRTSTVGARKV
jgi:hypothetical protein